MNLASCPTGTSSYASTSPARAGSVHPCTLTATTRRTSRVVQDIPPYATCVGYPAAVFGLNNEGLRRAGVSPEVKRRLHRAFRTLFHSKLSMSHALVQVEREADRCPELTHLLAFIRASKRGVARSA